MAHEHLKQVLISSLILYEKCTNKDGKENDLEKENCEKGRKYIQSKKVIYTKY